MKIQKMISNGHIMKKNRIFLLQKLLVFGAIVLSINHVFSATDNAASSSLRYYVQMQNEEFLRTMIPKEKYLLGLVRNVSNELKERRSEGLSASALGVDEMKRPEDVIAEAYSEEFNHILDLLNEIEHLESKAKQKADITSLQSLAQLKEKVKNVIEKKGNGKDDFDLIGKSQSKQTPPVKSTTAVDLEDKGYDSGDLFGELKYVRILDYKVKLTEYQFLQARLLNTADPKQKKRMLQRDLRQALEAYSESDFALARLQMQDILENYSDYLLDDIQFYFSEAAYGLNLLDEALAGYRVLIEKYPTSSFRANALVKTIYIYFIYNDLMQLSANYEQLIPLSGTLDPVTSGTVFYIVGYTYFRAAQYQKALLALAKIKSNMSYFYPSLYLAASCYSNLGKDKDALLIYDRLSREPNPQMDPVLFQIKNNSLLKLGLISYDRNQPELAISYFNRVSENLPNYDLSLLGKAWSAYQTGQPIETLENIETLLQSSLASKYMYEARVLAARSKEILGYKEEAIRELKGVYQERKATRIIQQNKTSLDNVDKVANTTYNIVDERNKKLYKEIEQIRTFLANSRLTQYGTNQSEQTLDSYSRSLEVKIQNLDRLEVSTKDARDLEDIRRLRSDLIQILQKQMNRSTSPSLGSASDPLVQRMGMSDYLKYMFRSLLLDILRDKDQTMQDLQEASDLIVRIQSQNDFDLSIRMEIRKEEMDDYYNKLNQYEVWLRENFPQQYQLELEQWTNFSGYGISNINFSRIKECEAQIANISTTVDALDKVFWSKRNKLELRIQGLLSDVAKIENQMKIEAEKNEQKERDRFFKQDYFDQQSKEAVAGSLKESPESGKGQGQ